MQRFHSPFFHLYGTNHDVLIVRHTFHHLYNIYRRVRQDELPEGQEEVPWGTTSAHRIQRLPPCYMIWETIMDNTFQRLVQTTP